VYAHVARHRIATVPLDIHLVRGRLLGRQQQQRFRPHAARCSSRGAASTRPTAPATQARGPRGMVLLDLALISAYSVQIAGDVPVPSSRKLRLAQWQAPITIMHFGVYLGASSKAAVDANTRKEPSVSSLKTDDIRANLSVWPLPQLATPYTSAVRVHRCVSSAIAVDTAHSRSGILRRGAQRYQKILQRCNEFHSFATGTLLRHVILNVSSDSEWLGSNTSYGYTLDVSVTGPARVECATPFGCLYALESLAQALHPSGCIAPVKISDHSQYPWRSIMLDVSSRFAPVPYILGQIRAMAMVKLNILHLHLSEGTYRLPTTVLPALNDGVRHYTTADVATIVDYAKDRGVRVVPEVDLPGHAMGFAPARNTSQRGDGLRFCNTSTLVQLFADPGNATQRTLTALLTEVSRLFPDEVFHLGGDETIAAPGYTGQCTLESFRSLLVEVQRVLRRLGKVPMGWNDLITRTHSALPTTIIDAWTGSDDNFTVDNATALGHQVVNSDSSAFYLMYHQCFP
jgi:N-acetyl-beta-hexosaminidase